MGSDIGRVEEMPRRVWQRHRSEPHVAAADRDRFHVRDTGCEDFAVTAAVGGVDGVIETPRRPVDAKLRVSLAETGQGLPAARRLVHRRRYLARTKCSGQPSRAQPPEHGITPLGKGSPSAKTVACS